MANKTLVEFLSDLVTTTSKLIADNESITLKPLNKCTIIEILQIIRSGKAREAWNIGDSMSPLSLKFSAPVLVGSLNQTTVTFDCSICPYIIGFDHNIAQETPSLSHTVTFIFGKTPEVYTDVAFFGVDAASSSSFYNYLYSNLPVEIQEAIVPTTKTNYRRTGTSYTSSSKLFTLSEYEVFGEVVNATNKNEYETQLQYEFYKTNSKVKYRHNDIVKPTIWTLRSPNYGTNWWCSCVDVNGAASNQDTSYAYNNAVAPAFTIG